MDTTAPWGMVGARGCFSNGWSPLVFERDHFDMRIRREQQSDTKIYADFLTPHSIDNATTQQINYPCQTSPPQR